MRSQFSAADALISTDYMVLLETIGQRLDQFDPALVVFKLKHPSGDDIYTLPTEIQWRKPPTTNGKWMRCWMRWGSSSDFYYRIGDEELEEDDYDVVDERR
ncbi:6046_t:CDS:2 [Paraglomus brasilianum]|uniref:6046_t:CDS:1 n=1 Tax=Paraglomus brasilianum TaxID=144538 RepID=A0A9N9ACH4_9GLOM|nr:6046_t:CDS:2 [Paraglomus brasilianum]